GGIIAAVYRGKIMSAVTKVERATCVRARSRNSHVAVIMPRYATQDDSGYTEGLQEGASLRPLVYILLLLHSLLVPLPLSLSRYEYLLHTNPPPTSQYSGGTPRATSRALFLARLDCAG
ncbi:unnamed protein product, partial [Ectocarpus sp. 12 AP-2014]